jgi:RND family efflux transporter MFP subunit
MDAALLVAVAIFAQLAVPPSAANTIPGSDPSYPAIIQADKDIRIYAEVEGLLTTLAVREGAYVKRGELIATIDDRTAMAALDVANSSFRAADERAKDKIEEQYAVKAAGVAEKTYQASVQANSGGQQVVSPIDLEKQKLDWERALLQIEKAKKDQILARFEADVKDAERRAAQVALVRREIRAPFDGQIEDMDLDESEWVNPGDPIMRLVQFNVMWVDSWVNSQDFDPSELQGRPVTLRITLARGREAKVPGRIIHVSQSTTQATQGYNRFRVRAEIDNQRTGDFWLVRPGLPAYMTIHVSQPAVTAAAAVPEAAAR